MQQKDLKISFEPAPHCHKLYGAFDNLDGFCEACEREGYSVLGVNHPFAPSQPQGLLPSPCT